MNKQRQKEEILAAEQDCEELEEELWLRSRGIIACYGDMGEEELEDCLNSAQNHFRYLVACWESDYPNEDWY